MLHLLPRPQNIKIVEGNFYISYNTRIIVKAEYESGMQTCINGLKEECQNSLGYYLTVIRGGGEENSIVISLDTTLKKEEYELCISTNKVELQGGSISGIFYGIQTLCQIVRQVGGVLPCLKILDYPNIANRGYYFDISRGRVPTLKTLKELVDKLSFYKINQLQLYIEHTYFFQELSEVWRDETPLTAEEVLELDLYCKNRNIELIPSLSTFGHMYKILRMKSYKHMCELEDQDREPFSLYDRMEQHTLDVSNPSNVEFIKKLIEEYMSLFSTKYFNICGDETYDLGKGRGKKLADEIGVNEMYIRYIKELCDFVISKDHIPMFWGDIIVGFPEMITYLPKETICLNWGYEPNQSENDTKAFYDVGANQYVCPGVNGWNKIMNHIRDGYENISRMCAYGRKYEAIGVLNTDWGDYGHVNDPEFSTVGVIYGASFSWNETNLSFEEVNKSISRIEYEDKTEKFVSVVGEVSEKSIFQWSKIVLYRDCYLKKKSIIEIDSNINDLNYEKVKMANEELGLLKQKMYCIVGSMDTSKRSISKTYFVAIDGMILFNQIGMLIKSKRKRINGTDIINRKDETDKTDVTDVISEIDPWDVASKLEKWFMHYKEIWRSKEKESELYRIQEVIIWYADLLREY
ncbi:MAG TPA: family 20 glycosylhydrolase [Lachnospiraceae bacterium]|nr:family 20 glycosylhydrolase [Lachnospiraceae bacterium]